MSEMNEATMTGWPNDPRRNRGTLFSLDVENEESLIGFATKFYEDGKRWKWPLVRGWYHNILMYLGNQYHEVNPETKRFEEVKATDEWRVRHRNNMIRPMVGTKIAKLTRQSPIMEVEPATTDQEDVRIARTSQKLVSYWWQNDQVDLRLIEAASWVTLAGNCFVRALWNKDSPPGVGDVEFSVVSPFGLLVHPLAKTIEDTPLIVEANVRDPDWLEERYPGSSNQVDAEDADYNILEVQLKSRSSADFNEHPRDAANAIRVLEIWIRPSRAFPDGYYYVVAGKKLVHKGPLPYRCFRVGGAFYGSLPYVHLRDSPPVGSFWSAPGSVEDSLPIQKSYNRTISAMMEIMNQTAKPKWLVPVEAGLAESQLTTEPGEKVFYNGPNPPTPATPTVNLSPWLEMLNVHERNFENATGQHEVSKAQAPPGLKSGIALSLLGEQDDNRLSPAAKYSAIGWARAISYGLAIASEKYAVPRLVKITGRNRSLDAVEFLGDRMVGPNASKIGVSYFDVRVAAGSAIPRSPAATKQFVIDLVGRGILNKDNPRHFKIIMQVLELGGPREGVFEDVELARSQAYIENVFMARGEPMEVNPWDDDNEHVMVVEEFERQPEFFEMVTRDPGLAGIFESHKEAHKNAAILKATLEQTRPMEVQQLLAAQGRLVPGPAMPQPQQAQPGPQMVNPGSPNPFIEGDASGQRNLGVPPQLERPEMAEMAGM